MNKKKSLLVVVALVLVCVMSIMGTVAFMKHNTGAVTNTFIASDGGSLASDLTLDESKATQAANGSYTLDTTQRVTANTYKVMPGMEIDKDPTITIEGKTEAPAYLFFEVVNPLDTSVYTYSFTGWTELTGVTGYMGGKVYVYGDVNGTIITDSNVAANYKILTGDKITVADKVEDLKLSADDANPTTMTFYAYLAQANVGADNDTPASVYTAVFPANAGLTPSNP